MSYLFTSESVSEGHPDKVADQISDAVLDAYLKEDPDSKVACETLVTTGLVVISGEVKSKASNVDVQEVARGIINKIGYNKASYKFDAESCGIISTLHEQSADINRGVVRAKAEEQGAGDQGMMFGYATNETDSYLPLGLDIAHRILEELAVIRKQGRFMKYLRPDSKSQVTIEYDDKHNPLRVETIIVSTQHDDFISAKGKTTKAVLAADSAMLKKIRADVINILMPRVLKRLPERVRKLFGKKITYHINPTGKFVIGGPHGDTGLTGRKIIVDTYGGRGAHGGGAFSGKDSSKVDRSAAYATRHIAKNLVAAGVADQVLVQVAYAIGVAKPVGFNVNTFHTSKLKAKNGRVFSDNQITKKIEKLFDMRPNAFIKRLGLRNPIFAETSNYGHMGKKPGKLRIQMNGKSKSFDTFSWEKLDYVPKIKKAFGI